MGISRTEGGARVQELSPTVLVIDDDPDLRDFAWCSAEIGRTSYTALRIYSGLSSVQTSRRGRLSCA